MYSKALQIVSLIVGFSILAALAGFGLGRMSHGKGGPVVIFDERTRAGYLRSIEDLAEYDRHEKDLMANLRPLVKAGPLVIYLNESTGDYLVCDERGDPVTLKLTDGDETNMTYFGPDGGHVTVELSYKRGTTELRHSAFSTFGDGGYLGGNDKYIYLDIDGDGRIDRLFDWEVGKLYEQKDMQWVLIQSVKTKGEILERIKSREELKKN